MFACWMGGAWLELLRCAGLTVDLLDPSSYLWSDTSKFCVGS